MVLNEECFRNKSLFRAILSDQIPHSLDLIHLMFALPTCGLHTFSKLPIFANIAILTTPMSLQVNRVIPESCAAGK
jgi:hypothetical protein